jgi:hypothetical protein
VTLTLAEWHAWRDTDAEMVAAVAARLEQEGATDALTHLARLSVDERALLARFERQQAHGLPALNTTRSFNPETERRGAA